MVGQNVIKYLYLVKAEAARVSKSLPYWYDYDDAFSAGCVGLVSAANKLWVDKRDTFVAYAKIKISGAIKDDMKKLDPVSRRARSASRHGLLTDTLRLSLLLGSYRHIINTDSDTISNNYPGQYELVLWRERRSLLYMLISRLPGKQKIVVTEFLKCTNTSDIAKQIGVTNSRVTQILYSSVERLISDLRRRDVVATQNRLRRNYV